MEVEVSRQRKNKYGQYFTPEVVADFMIDMADSAIHSKILEPSCGAGVFLDLLTKKGFNNIVAYEIDENLANDFPFVRYESFISAEIEEQFDLVIGNPPYIRWKNLEEELKSELSKNFLWNKYFNALCDYLYIFILKSIEVLKDNGQLIFICPEYWMNTTHSASLRNYMMQHGFFEEIYHFNETPIFENVTVSIVIFKYIKGKRKKDKIKVSKFYANQKITSQILNNLKKGNVFNNVEYLEVSQFQINERWLLETDENQERLTQLEVTCKKQTQPSLFDSININHSSFYTIGDVCDIGNGLVSGLDKAFQIQTQDLTKTEKLATIDVIKAKDLKPYFGENITKYIFINDKIEENEFQKNYPNFYLHFQKYKPALENRYQYNRKIQYWEWVFLRNFNLFNKAAKRIFVPCKERISNKNYFRFALVQESIFPTQDVTAIFKKENSKESIEYILSYLNLPIIFDWLKSNGIVKGNIVEFSEKPIASIPFKKINWDDKHEVMLHNAITKLVTQYLTNKDDRLLCEINRSFNLLFERIR